MRARGGICWHCDTIRPGRRGSLVSSRCTEERREGKLGGLTEKVLAEGGTAFSVCRVSERARGPRTRARTGDRNLGARVAVRLDALRPCRHSGFPIWIVC